MCNETKSADKTTRKTTFSSLEFRLFEFWRKRSQGTLWSLIVLLLPFSVQEFKRRSTSVSLMTHKYYCHWSIFVFVYEEGQYSKNNCKQSKTNCEAAAALLGHALHLFSRSLGLRRHRLFCELSIKRFKTNVWRQEEERQYLPMMSCCYPFAVLSTKETKKQQDD